jgi:hypothetical protein
MAGEWKLLSQCSSYAEWLADELDDRRLAYQMVDEMLFHKNYGGARYLCDDCPVKDICIRTAYQLKEKGWWGISERARKRQQSYHQQPALLASQLKIAG